MLEGFENGVPSCVNVRPGGVWVLDGKSSILVLIGIASLDTSVMLLLLLLLISDCVPEEVDSRSGTKVETVIVIRVSMREKGFTGWHMINNGRGSSRSYVDFRFAFEN